MSRSLALVSTSQVVFKYTEALALDLRVFAKHGKRAGVGVDDVKCVARKDPKMVGTSINKLSHWLVSYTSTLCTVVDLELKVFSGVIFCKGAKR